MTDSDDDADITELIDVNDQKGGHRFRRMLLGALKATIQTHGPITLSNLASAEKRIRGAIKQWNQFCRENDDLEGKAERPETPDQTA